MMLQLEHALELLADRAEPLPIDVLVHRLEMRLIVEGSSLDAAVSVETVDLEQPPGLGGSLPHRRRWHGPALAVGFAAAAFVLIGGVVWLLGHGGSEVVEEPMPTTTTTSASVPDVLVPVAVNALPDSSAPAPIDEISGVSVADGSLWVATDGGMVRWDIEDRSAEVFTPDSGLPLVEGGLGTVVVAPDGEIWASSWTQDVVMFDGARWTEPHGYDQVDIVNPRCVAGEECRNPITAMAIGPDNLVSLAVGPETLLQFDGTAWNVTPVSDVETHGDGADAWATDIAVASDGTLWIASWEELLRYDGTRWDRFAAADGLPAGAINSVAVAPNGDIWVGTTDDSEGEAAGGVARFDGDDWNTFDEGDGLYANAVTAMTVGPDGIVWTVHAGTDAPATSTERATGGLSRFDGETWSPTAIANVGAGFGWGGAAVDDSGTLWVSSRWGVVGIGGAEAVVLRVDETARPTIDVAHTVIEGDEDILATTVAKAAAPIATCPAGSDPDRPGPVDQARPPLGSYFLLSAFDRQSGRVVAVARSEGGVETWTFDVCSNTWMLMRQPDFHRTADPAEPRSILVYDADSDRVVAIGASVNAYDVDTDTWERYGDAPFDGDLSRTRAVYDPVSGLVVVRDIVSSELWAYDVDTDAWTSIRQGPISPPGSGDVLDGSGSGHRYDQLHAYDASADRIMLYVSDSFSGPGVWDGAGTEMTWTYDLRAGEWTVEDTATPELHVGGYYVLPGKAAYDETTRRTVITGDGVVGAYDSARHEWEILRENPSEPSAYGSGSGPHHRFDDQVMYDPTNDRIVVIGGYARMREEEPFWVDMDDVWAFETATGTWVELLASSNP
ncbi:MAG: two-component regulator propeller domain-containing protein [Acidimicrobiia bacterium]